MQVCKRGARTSDSTAPLACSFFSSYLPPNTRVAFKEAATVFGDPLAWFQPDAERSLTEDRLLLLGRSSADRLLAILFTDRGDELVRIISARCATPRERKKYEKDFR